MGFSCSLVIREGAMPYRSQGLAAEDDGRCSKGCGWSQESRMLRCTLAGLDEAAALS